jgi:hypothetical protein
MFCLISPLEIGYYVSIDCPLTQKGTTQEEQVMPCYKPVKTSFHGQCNLLFSATFRLALQVFGTTAGACG